MNREDLIRNLKYTMKKHENDRINTFETDISMLCKDTLEVLEPQQVIYEGDGYADGKMVYDIARCPNCDYTYEADDLIWNEPFCPRCGQALNWEPKE